MLQDILSRPVDHARMPPRRSNERIKDRDRIAYNRDLGPRLVIARKGAGLEPEQVAKALRMPLNTYLKYERGVRQFPMHRILDFCILTRFSPAFVVTGRHPDDWQVGPDTGKFRKPHLPAPAPIK